MHLAMLSPIRLGGALLRDLMQNFALRVGNLN